MTYGIRQLKAAREKLQGQEHEIEDCKALIENITSLLAKKKLKTDSSEFGLIMALIKRVKRGEEHDSYSESDE